MPLPHVFRLIDRTDRPSGTRETWQPPWSATTAVEVALLVLMLMSPTSCGAVGALLEVIADEGSAFSCKLSGQTQGGASQSVSGQLWLDDAYARLGYTRIWPSGVEGSSPLFGSLTITCWDVQTRFEPLPQTRYVLHLPREALFWLARDEETGLVRRRWPQNNTETLLTISRCSDRPYLFALIKARGIAAPGSGTPLLHYAYASGRPLEMPFVPFTDGG